MEERFTKRSAGTPVLVAADLVTGYGRGLAPCWDALLDGRSAISRVTRFSTEHAVSDQAATVQGLDPSAEASLAMQMLTPCWKG